MAHLWTLDQLKSTLDNHPQVKGWIVNEETIQRRERYFLAEKGGALVIDQDREVEVNNLSARLFVKLDDASRQGEVSKKFFYSLPLAPQLDSAIAAGLQTSHQAWPLPTAATELPSVQSADPAIVEDLEGSVSRLTQDIATAVATPRDARFDSAELFLSIHRLTKHLSNGLIHRSLSTRIYVEAAYSCSKQLADGSVFSDEYLDTRWSVRLADVDVAGLFEQAANHARYAVEVSKTEAGRYPVIIHADVLATLFHDQISQLSGSNAYHQLPFVAVGDALIKSTEGDLISLALDPQQPFGADTVAISGQGVPQALLPLVEQNRVVATAADQQFAHYLNLPAPTTVRGTVTVAGGRHSYASLTKAAPQVLEILQFSGLFTDANSGTFGSEIRLARLHDNINGTVRYLKGGSLGGAVQENFKGLKLSDVCVRHSHFDGNNPVGQAYFGPECALLTEVSVAA
ncbi:metallopeptidase TldD-related protein [Parachitinimonas caeni]|uniref:Metallopeptidase TldD-related protein n=1 Tax=Parachitinimonas caeni TaxID=3031301 RepID=A0ABT7E4T6_9NEIS|nr:metallopeptidase TldD-related protein [Parachitinimonas caeni]MDK2126383.1 metallopeptidase TldD-related protein [Parachitinimonas caeni]